MGSDIDLHAHDPTVRLHPMHLQMSLADQAHNQPDRPMRRSFIKQIRYGLSHALVLVQQAQSK